MRTEYPGIDYGNGQTNIDKVTGIRYGIIACNRVPYIWNDLEPVYNVCCPHCGSELVDEFDAEFCETCGKEIESHDLDGLEPACWKYEQDEIIAETNSDNTELWILKSPFITHAQFCSPCVPGAGNLNSPCASGPVTYCLPLDYFDGDNPCPYADDITKA